jgi:DNA-binding MarR family transcriptional regulator
MLNKMSNASRLVEKLKQKGLVLREECPADRRQVDIMITEKGLQLLNQLQEEILNQNNNLIQLSQQEVSQLNFLLDKLRG